MAENQSELEALKKANKTWGDFEKAKAEILGFKKIIGLTKEEERLEPLKRQTGLFSGMVGKQFEMAALKVMEDYVFADLRERESGDVHLAATQPLVLLSNLTMGTGFELDQLVILPAENSEEPVEVLALVEVKRNVNDVCRSFIQLQKVLNWCTGARDRYGAEEHINKSNRSGHFERPIYHEEEGKRYMVSV